MVHAFHTQNKCGFMCVCVVVCTYVYAFISIYKCSLDEKGWFKMLCSHSPSTDLITVTQIIKLTRHSTTGLAGIVPSK